MAENINDELENAGFTNLGVDERKNLVVLKRTQMPAVLVEVGFINNDEDNKTFDENFNKIAQAIANGILKTIYSQDINYNEVPQENYSRNESAANQNYTTMPLPNNQTMSPFSEEEVPEQLYRVQVGAYKNKDNADRMLNSLQMEGFPAFIIMEDGYYKVQVGAFRYLTNAIKMEQRLRRFRYSTYIVYN
jgi:N-acetylmuramoyl-L-alanine amidase